MVCEFHFSKSEKRGGGGGGRGRPWPFEGVCFLCGSKQPSSSKRRVAWSCLRGDGCIDASSVFSLVSHCHMPLLPPHPRLLTSTRSSPVSLRPLFSRTFLSPDQEVPFLPASSVLTSAPPSTLRDPRNTPCATCHTAMPHVFSVPPPPLVGSSSS